MAERLTAIKLKLAQQREGAAAAGTTVLQDADNVYKIPDIDDIDNYLQVGVALTGG